MQTIAFNLENEMSVLKHKFKCTVEAGKEILLVTDYAGYVKYISDEVYNILHFDAISLFNKNIVEFASEFGKEKIKEILEIVNQKDEEQLHLDKMELRCISNENHYFDALVYKKKTNGGSNFVFYLLDNTEKVKTSERIDSLNFELDNFIYKTSHDLRAPILSVIGLLNLIEKDENDFQPKGIYQKLIRKSIDRLDRYVTQLSQYEKLKNDELQSSSIHLKSLINKIVDDYQNLYDGHSIKLYLHIPEDLTFTSDSFRTEIILSNVISNAIKYHNVNQSHPFIRIYAEVKLNKLVISITDNGIGIPADMMCSIFKMHTRGTNLSDGSGLGLYLAKQAAQKINAKVEVKSKEDIGTNVIINFPI